MNRKFLFTSESVTEGHPDKVADQISDSVLDRLIEQDKKARVACETLVTTGMVFIAGEITSSYSPDFQAVARDVLKKVGYTDPSYGISADHCAVVVSVDKQSPDISMGVDSGGAGDQGIMFGFACDETEELMPLPIVLAHKITKRLAHLRKSGYLPWLRPDGKSQVTVEYEGWGNPKRIDTVLVSTQHDPDIKSKDIYEAVVEEVVKPILPSSMVESTKFLVNPTGRFVIGGPHGDCGLTGRKIIVDTYGGVGRHGGGAFSGKDPTKVDRSASYMARAIAKSIVKAKLASRVEVQLAYAIGKKEPVSVYIDSFGTSVVADEDIEKVVLRIFDLTPEGIIRTLRLDRPIFAKTACYGHFGRKEPEFSWEHVDKFAQKLSELLPVSAKK